MKPEGQSVFCYYYTQCQKQLVILWSPSHQHNAHTVPTTATESPGGFGSEPGLPKESPELHLGLIIKPSERAETNLATPLGRPGLDILKTIQFPHVEIQCLYSFTTPQEGWRENYRERLHN